VLRAIALRTADRRVAPVARGLVLALLACARAAAQASEPWADPVLPVTGGLELWLDASRLPAPQGTLPALVDGEAVAAWPDASGARRDARQAAIEQRPRLILASDDDAGGGGAGPAWAVRFDGRDDLLALGGLGERLEQCTLIVAAVPLSNAGGFRALTAFREADRNDYQTGLTLDLGPAPSPALECVNLEGAEFTGARDLLDGEALPFGALRVLSAVCGPGSGGVRLYVDGRPAGARDRREGVLRLDELLVGARCYSNTAAPPAPTGFLDGCVAEVLLYGRALDERERGQVEGYLARKHAGLARAVAERLARSREKPLVPASPVPELAALVPGFTARRLPLDLPNANNVRVRPDGKLFVLGYDGTVRLCSDEDGDGLEETARVFWDRPGLLAPIGMALTPEGAPYGRGLFVAAQGKLALVVDTDGDDRGDREIVVAQGWRALERTHNVDALGVAVDGRGDVFFGLGTADYTNPYLLDAAGAAHYDRSGERGTIQRVSADFATRETFCTGVRFPVALAFNAAGDLFATDQEGATWLANGNPLDELLHVQAGRHYGFPPRHPRHLSGVVDEPAVAEYAPQHQSACGLCFDEPASGGALFGPPSWRGCAFVTGYSRGKLWRTELARGPGGYVARTSLFACSSRLLVDVCLAPNGELVVAAHSGGPDWGSGPGGRGALYRVSYSDRDAPQPLFAAPVAPGEVRIAFDRPLDPRDLAGIARRVELTRGRYVRAGDRFEVLRPGYQVVADQLASPRFNLPVRAVAVTADRRSLLVETDPEPDAAPRALVIRDFARGPADEGAPAQSGDLDLGYDLSGLRATWSSPAGEVLWSGWLPHVDLALARALTEGSAEHEELWRATERPGRLMLAAQLDLAGMLRPAVQPGATLDHRPEPEQVTVALESSAALELRTAPGTRARDGRSFTCTPSALEPVPIEIELVHGGGALSASLTWSTREDPRPRALSPGRILVPWARVAAGAGEPRADDGERGAPPELAGGDWARGRRVFLSDEAQCSRCHSVDGLGGAIGPDLSNLRQRDLASVRRDVEHPSHALHPDYIAHRVQLADGTQLTGTVRVAGTDLVVGDAQGVEVTVAREDVAALVPQGLSIMPEGLGERIGGESLRDLFTFLLVPPPPELRPAPLVRPDAPPPRPAAELERVRSGARPSTAAPRPLSIALVAGAKDHGPDEHDYPLWQARWSSLLALAEGVTVTQERDWPSAAALGSADVIVMYSSNPAWGQERAGELDAFLRRGGGLVLVHWAVNGRAEPEAFAARVGLASRPGSRYRHGPLELVFDRAADHPITRGFDVLRLVDESYWELAGDPGGVQVLATSVEDGAPRPQLWTVERGGGRVFACIPGHYTWSFDDPLVRVLLLRGIAWCAGEDVDRFDALATVGARR